MANGLTDSDLNRQRLGFGVSPDTASRRRAVEAGVAPLTTGEQIRRGWGWGPSTPEEQKAFQAAEVIERGGPAEQMPVEYGGRPTGTSRREMRMRAEYDAAQQDYLRNQLIGQQMEESAIRMEEVGLAREAQEMEKARQAKIRDEAKFIFDSIRGGVQTGTDEAGNPIFSEPINPSNERDLERITNLMGSQYGMENAAARQAVMRLYEDALKAQESRATQAERGVQEQQSWLIGQQEEAATLGIDATKFFTADPQTGTISKVDQLGLSKAIGEAKRKDLENKNKEIASAKLDEETKGLARSVLDEINKTDSEIRKANFDAGRTKGTIRDENVAKAEFLRSERDVLVERFNGLMPQKPAEGAGQAQPEIPKFNTPEEAEAAGLQAGTIVEIGGRRARID
jgi:hypothetical protein